MRSFKGKFYKLEIPEGTEIEITTEIPYGTEINVDLHDVVQDYGERQLLEDIIDEDAISSFVIDDFSEEQFAHMLRARGMSNSFDLDEFISNLETAPELFDSTTENIQRINLLLRLVFRNPAFRIPVAKMLVELLLTPTTPVGEGVQS